MEKCKICGEECSSYVGLTTHLRSHKMLPKLYYDLYLKTSNSEGFCATCGKPTSFGSISKGYHKFCCLKCSANNEDTRTLYKNTCLEKYGVENVFLNDEIKDKITNTMVSKYGVEHSLQSEELLNKSKQTCLDRYGVEYAMQSDEIKDRLKASNLEKYGVENVFLSEEIKNKIKVHIQNTYGVDYYLLTKEFKDKYKLTCLFNYGVDHPFQSDIIKEKSKLTCLEKYGVEYALQSDVVKEKAKQTCLEKYGVEYASLSDEFQLHVRDTSKEKYGVDHFLQNDLIREKCRNTCLEKYGVDNYSKTDEFKDKSKSTCLEKYGVEHVMQNELIKQKLSNVFYEKYGVDWYCMLPECRSLTRSNSNPNRLFEELLHLYNIEYEREFPIHRYSYDFKIDNFLIEINPSATHNSTWNPYSVNLSGIDKFYHFKKSRCAIDNHYSFIAIWDWDSSEDIVKKLSKKDYSFLSTNDLNKFIYTSDVNLDWRNPIITKHWFNMRTVDHIYDNYLIDSTKLLLKGYVEIYDCGMLES